MSATATAGGHHLSLAAVTRSRCQRTRSPARYMLPLMKRLAAPSLVP